MRLRRTPPKERTYLLEPATPEPEFSSQASELFILKHSTSPYAVLGRRRVNSWINNWDFDDREKIISRLESDSLSNYEGAIWELYLNSLARYLGFLVTREPEAVNGKRPDFKLKRLFSTFYLEGTTISREPNAVDAKHWITLISALENIQRDDFQIGIRCEKSSELPPRVNKLIRKIQEFLDSLDYESVRKLDIFDLPQTSIREDDWILQITVLPKKERSLGGRFIAIEGNLNSPFITDLDDLRTKIKKKRKRYGKLDAPFVLAILENSFVLSSDYWHRHGALFGREAVRIGSNSESEGIRLSDGIWDPITGETNVASLLLLNRLLITFEEMDLPELWTNPKLPSKGISRIFKLKHHKLIDGEYRAFDTSTKWDGLQSPPIKSRFLRTLTLIIRFSG